MVELDWCNCYYGEEYKIDRHIKNRIRLLRRVKRKCHRYKMKQEKNDEILGSAARKVLLK